MVFSSSEEKKHQPERGKKSKGGGCQLSRTIPAPAPWVTGVLANTASCPGSFSQWERRVSQGWALAAGTVGSGETIFGAPSEG